MSFFKLDQDYSNMNAIYKALILEKKKQTETKSSMPYEDSLIKGPLNS